MSPIRSPQNAKRSSMLFSGQEVDTEGVEGRKLTTMSKLSKRSAIECLRCKALQGGSLRVS